MIVPLKFKPSFLRLSSNSNKTGVLFVCSKSNPAKSHNFLLPQGQPPCSSLIHVNCLGSIPDTAWSSEARGIASITPSATYSFFDLHKINRLRPSLSPNRTTVLVNTPVSSHLGSCLSHLSCLPLKFINKCYWFRLPLPSPSLWLPLVHAPHHISCQMSSMESGALSHTATHLSELFLSSVTWKNTRKSSG